jgi:hypothetical protein
MQLQAELPGASRAAEPFFANINCLFVVVHHFHPNRCLLLATIVFCAYLTSSTCWCFHPSCGLAAPAFAMCFPETSRLKQ